MVRNTLGIFVCAALAGFGLAIPLTALPGNALAGATEAKDKPAWAKTCPKDKDGKVLGCRLTQRVFVKKGEKKWLLLAVQIRHPNAGEPHVYVHLPHGMMLPSGIALAVMKENAKEPVVTYRLQVLTCDKLGCYSKVHVEEKLIVAMKAGKTLNVSFVNLKKKTISVPLPLKGFSKAYETLLENTK